MQHKNKPSVRMERWLAFWFAVTLSFAWSYYALGRHLDGTRPWRSLAIGLVVIAAAVDLVGVLVTLTILPEIAWALAGNIDPTLLTIFQFLEKFSHLLINVSAFGLYSVAGLVFSARCFCHTQLPALVGLARIRGVRACHIGNSAFGGCL